MMKNLLKKLAVVAALMFSATTFAQSVTISNIGTTIPSVTRGSAFAFNFEYTSDAEIPNLRAVLTVRNTTTGMIQFLNAQNLPTLPATMTPSAQVFNPVFPGAATSGAFTLDNPPTVTADGGPAEYIIRFLLVGGTPSPAGTFTNAGAIAGPPGELIATLDITELLEPATPASISRVTPLPSVVSPEIVIGQSVIFDNPVIIAYEGLAPNTTFTAFNQLVDSNGAQYAGGGASFTTGAADAGQTTASGTADITSDIVGQTDTTLADGDVGTFRTNINLVPVIDVVTVLTADTQLSVFDNTKSIDGLFGPNPATDVIEINVATETYQVVNLAGATVINAAATGSLNVSGLSAGLYFLVTDAGIAKFVKN